MKTKKQFMLFLFAFFFGSSLWAQENTAATGGEATGTGGTVSFTVGQIDYSAQSGTNGSVSQGVQQPLEFFNVGIEENVKNFSVLLFPNPTVAELHVDLKKVSLDQLNYILTDASGKQVQTSEVSSAELTINMVDYNRGNYFLNFVQNGKVVGSYKVIKN